MSTIPSKQTMSKSFVFGTLLTIFITTLLFLYTMLVIHVTRQSQTSGQVGQTGISQVSNRAEERSSRHATFPALLIYRRSMKTGSSSMCEALLQALQPRGYVTLSYKPPQLRTVLHHLYVRNDLTSLTLSSARDGRPVDPSQTVRNKFASAFSAQFSSNESRRVRTVDDDAAFTPRVLLVQHNDFVKSVHPDRDALIIDTFRSGYEQITSFCTHMQRVPSCDDIEAMQDCLLSNVSRAQNWYRWAGRRAEDDDTYIDLPLSSAHPALSTTVFRTVFPGAILNISIYNHRGSTCLEHEALKQIYNEYYSELESQVQTLQHRMLLIAGYPTVVSKKGLGKNYPKKMFSYRDMLDAAEREERRKYPQLDKPPEDANRLFSEGIRDFQKGFKRWVVDSDGHLQAALRGGLAK